MVSGVIRFARQQQRSVSTVRTCNMMIAGLILGAAVTGGSEMAAADLKVGDDAPAFAMKGSDGKTHKLSDYKGKKAVVVAWFPKAFTGG